MNNFEVKKEVVRVFSSSFVEAVKEICLLANECGIPIYDGRAQNPLTPQNIHEWITDTHIFINGCNNRGKKQFHHTFAFVLDTSFFKWEQTDHCDTKGYPYDLIVKLILCLAHNYGYVSKKPTYELLEHDYCISADVWESFENFLKKTTKSHITLNGFREFWGIDTQNEVSLEKGNIGFPTPLKECI